MTLDMQIKQALDTLRTSRKVADGVVQINTDCVYPDYSTVTVVVHQNAHSFSVTDGGHAVEYLRSYNMHHNNWHRYLSRFTKTAGLTVAKGEIWAEEVSAEALGVAIIAVANTAKEAADVGHSQLSIRKEKSFKDVFRTFMEHRFSKSEILHEYKLPGESNLLHTFDIAVPLPGERLLIIDPVVPDASSVNSKVVAHLDIRNMGRSDIIQRVIYDDQDNWKAGNLSLLRLGATPVPYTSAAKNLEDMVSHTVQ